jgi:predicted nucleic acid-binding protein
MGWVALLDACVLYPMSTRDLLLRGAERYLYQVRWSAEVIAEMRDGLVRDARMSSRKAESLATVMLEAFPEALVGDYEALIPSMTNNEPDRHVLAAAVAARADVLVTLNVRHFPPESCEPYGLEVQTPDEFLAYSFDLAPEVMTNVFLTQVAELKRPTFTVNKALVTLGERLPSFADRLRKMPTVTARL